MSAIAELLGRTLVVVAHPDDEVIGCGALLQRMTEPVVVFCTDGAPRQAQWWRRYGSREAYSRLRRGEARQALSHAGVSKFEFLADASGESFVDQELFKRIADVVAALHKLIDRYQPGALLTHAYEGGHPDHDTCCFVTSIVAREAAIPVWEMPLYRRDERGDGIRQQFVQSTSNIVELQASAAEVERKRRMFEAYTSQGNIASAFDARVERLRPLHRYDFSQPPHEGKLNYEIWCWEMTGREVADAFNQYLKMGKTKTAIST